MSPEWISVALAFARMFGVVLLLPYLGGRAVPGPAKVALAAGLAALLAPELPEMPGTPALLILGFKELLVGLAIGFLASLPFFAAQMAGGAIDAARGQTAVDAMVPGVDERQSPSAGLLYLLLAVVYLTAGGHRVLIGALAASFEVVPLLSAPPMLADDALLGFIGLSAELFVLALALSLPVLLLGLLVDVATGMLGRAGSRLHAYFLALPVRSLLGLLVLLVSLTAILDVLLGRLDQVAELIRGVPAR